MVQNAVLRSLEVIGDAVNGIDCDVRNRAKEVPWRRIAGMRDVLIHHCFGVDLAPNRVTCVSARDITMTVGDMKIPATLWVPLLGMLAVSCKDLGERCHVSCALEEQLFDGRVRFSCLEVRNVDTDELDTKQSECTAIAGRETYVSSKFSKELCPTTNVVAGCGGTSESQGTFWFYPNSDGYPSASEVKEVCIFRGLEYLPAAEQ